jgi:hypothetical protein
VHASASIRTRWSEPIRVVVRSRGELLIPVDFLGRLGRSSDPNGTCWLLHVLGALLLVFMPRQM